MLVNLGLPGNLDAQTDLFRHGRDKASYASGVVPYSDLVLW